MKLGYARVSSRDQNLTPQIEAPEEAGCNRIFQDVACGAKSERPGLDELMTVLTEVLTGHPELSNDLKRPMLEEIGARATTFILDSFQKHKKDYIQWLFTQCLQPETKPESIIKPEAVEYSAEALATPLQINQYLSLLLTEALHAGIKPVTEELVKSLLAYDLSSTEAQLVHQGYDARILADALDIKSKEVRGFIRAELSSTRRDEIMSAIKGLGVVL